MRNLVLGLLTVTLTWTIPNMDANGVPATDAEWCTVYGRPLGYMLPQELARVWVKGRAGESVAFRLELAPPPGWPRWWAFTVTTTDTAGNVSGPSNVLWSVGGR